MSEEIELPGDLFPLSDASLPGMAMVVTAAFVGVAFLAFLVFARSRRKSAPSSRSPGEPPVPAGRIAREKIRVLRARPLCSEPEIRAAFLEASVVLREFLQAQFGLPAQLRTSEEILKALTHEESEISGLKSLLHRCDLAKFSRSLPEAREREGFFEDADRYFKEPAP